MEVEELLNSRDVYYKHSGRDLVVNCLNPNHDDSNPSMRIDRDTGIFHCFSCGYKGNVYEEFGLIITPLQVKRNKLAQTVQELRGENIGLKLPPDAIPFDRDYRGIRAETYKQFGAFTHPSFADRVVFPVKDITGKICVLQARALTPDTTPKYLNHPRKVQLPLYPLTARPIEGRAILVEGIFDMLNMHDKGLTNTICCFGTQGANKEKLQILKMLGVHKVEIFFDGDDAGQDAAKQLAEVCKQIGLDTGNICFKNTDPGALSQKQVDKIKEAKWQAYF